MNESTFMEAFEGAIEALANLDKAWATASPDIRVRLVSSSEFMHRASILSTEADNLYNSMQSTWLTKNKRR